MAKYSSEVFGLEIFPLVTLLRYGSKPKQEVTFTGQGICGTCCLIGTWGNYKYKILLVPVE